MVFWCLQGVQNENISKKWVTDSDEGERHHTNQLSICLQFFDKEYNTSAQLGFLEGRDPNIRKGLNQHKTKTKRI